MSEVNSAEPVHDKAALPAPQTSARLWIGLGVVVLGALVVVGIIPRLHQREALANAEHALSEPRLVRVAPVVAGQKKVEFSIAASSTPYYSTSLFAKSVGFLRKNYVEVGDHVKTGQILAEIAAPETEEEVRLAQARFEEAEANVGLSNKSAERNGQLAGSGVVSQERADDTRAQANSAQAALKTRRAELSRASVLRGYQRVVAPFDGIVTRRGADPGALVGPTSMATGALFDVAQVDRLRVFVDVPQVYARDVVLGSGVSVVLPSNPTKPVAGKVVRTSTVLDPLTRTLRTEIEIGGDSIVLPGAFVYVKFSLDRSDAPLIIPATALLVRKEGTQVAVVSDGKVKIVTVQLGRDMGKELELLAGVAAGDKVILNPPDDLPDGAAVRVAEGKPDEKH